MSIIRCNLGGGLGNQIFQYLAAMHVHECIAKSSIQNDFSGFTENSFRKPLLQEKLIHIKEFSRPSNWKPRLPNRIKNSIYDKILHAHYKNGSFRDSTFANEIYIKQAVLKNTISIEQRGDDGALANSMAKEIINAKNADLKNQDANFTISIDDYWQDPRIYSTSKLFEYSEPLLKGSKDGISFAPSTYLAIHIRRGDYYSNIAHMQEYCSRHSTISFIQASLGLLPSDLRSLKVIAVSDEPEWCKRWINNLSGFENKITVIDESNDPWRDWYLINNARVSIISNSTFSFTASMLNKANIGEKIRIIMPQWYNNRMTTFHKGWTSIGGCIDV